MSWKDVFQEVPIKLHSSTLAHALIADLDIVTGASAADLERLNLSSAPFESKCMEGLVECVDDLLNEQQKVSMYHRQVRQQTHFPKVENDRCSSTCMQRLVCAHPKTVLQVHNAATYPVLQCHDS